MMISQPGTLVLLLLLLPAHVTAADRVLEVIPMQHRLVSDVIPVIEPLVEPGGTVTGSNNQLIIKSTPANIAEIREVLANLDRAPRQLMITVTQSQNLDSRQREQGLSGRYSNGEITVETDGLRRKDLEARIEDREGNRLRYEMRDHNSRSESRNAYRVQGTEGYPAHIQSGELYPFPRRSMHVAPGNVVVQDSYEYLDATSGFYVLPRIQGDTVTLEIAPRVTQVQRGRGPPLIQLQNVQTVVSGRLGEWIPVGGVDQSGQRNDQRLLNRGSSQSSEQGRILIRVDEIRD